MNNRKVKSWMHLTLIALLLTVLAPYSTYAQKKKVTKAKVTTPVKHYKNVPRRGAQVTKLPKKSVVVTHQNTNYHYKNGVFYRPVNGSYVVSAPPIGLRVTALPPKPYKVMLAGHPYY